MAKDIIDSLHLDPDYLYQVVHSYNRANVGLRVLASMLDFTNTSFRSYSTR
jgi:hypothetical protein